MLHHSPPLRPPRSAAHAGCRHGGHSVSPARPGQGCPHGSGREHDSCCRWSHSQLPQVGCPGSTASSQKRHRRAPARSLTCPHVSPRGAALPRCVGGGRAPGTGSRPQDDPAAVTRMPLVRANAGEFPGPGRGAMLRDATGAGRPCGLPGRPRPAGARAPAEPLCDAQPGPLGAQPLSVVVRRGVALPAELRRAAAAAEAPALVVLPLPPCHAPPVDLVAAVDPVYSSAGNGIVLPPEVPSDP
eukprot:gene7105-biopygen7106